MPKNTKKLQTLKATFDEAFEFFITETPNLQEMMDLRHHINREVKKAGFKGYKRQISLPYGTLDKLLSGDQNAHEEAYDVVLEHLYFRWPRKRDQLDEITDVLQTAVVEAIESDAEYKSRRFFCALSGIRPKKKKLQSGLEIQWEAIPDRQEDLAPQLLKDQLEAAILKANLNVIQLNTLQEIFKNPDLTFTEIAKELALNESEEPVKTTSVAHKLNVAKRKIIAKAQELGYTDLEILSIKHFLKGQSHSENGRFIEEALKLKLLSAVEKTALDPTPQEIVLKIIENPKITLDEIAAQLKPEAKEALTTEAIRLRLNGAVNAITAAAEELGFGELAALGRSFLSGKRHRGKERL